MGAKGRLCQKRNSVVPGAIDTTVFRIIEFLSSTWSNIVVCGVITRYKIKIVVTGRFANFRYKRTKERLNVGVTSHATMRPCGHIYLAIHNGQPTGVTGAGAGNRGRRITIICYTAAN